jgi:hypothetical protein
MACSAKPVDVVNTLVAVPVKEAQQQVKVGADGVGALVEQKQLLQLGLWAEDVP